MYKSQTLDNIRQKIDTIDNTIHDLLMERAALAASIAAEKRKRGMPVVHPAREARMIRRLLTRHKGDLPKQAVARIWRELVSAVSMLQSGLTAQFYSHQGRGDDLKIVTDYFGSILPVKRAESIASVLQAVAANTADFAIIPCAVNASGQEKWLPALLRVLENDVDNDHVTQAVMPVSIVQSMPFICDATHKDKGDDRYLIMARTYFEASGDDFSYIALRAHHAFDDALIERAFSQSALKLIDMSDDVEDGIFYRLCRIDGFVDKDTPSLVTLQDLLGPTHSVYAIGGYPKPIYV